jgi:serine protease AprX
MINGNELDTSKRKATESLESRYILVQSRVPFSKADITKLEEAGAKYLDYVSENTYLCRYQDGGPKQIPITELDFVVYLGVYGQEFKISPRLKEARDAQPDQEYEVDVIVHKDVDLKSTDVLEDLRNDIIEKAQCGDSDVQFVQNKARLNIKGRHLDDVASIFDVHHIEDVAKLVLYNDVARQILEISGRPPVIPQRYAGKGQVIAITDTGLDGGEHNMTHPAFQGRVRSWRSEHNFTADEDGHGTHVCGSAVGGGSTDTRLIHGTAPQAELVVQSIYNPSTGKLSTPRSLTDLFDDAYAQGARVHSNSWGECEDPFRQLGYTTHAGEIEKFMYEHPDTIMCWAAGNDHHAQAQSGQIGAEAAAKNCITVGASERSSGPNNPKINEIAIFSSRGPTISKFHKPDVVAPGTGILSANSGSAIGDHPKWPGPDKYSCYMSGTSMATPLVAGCAAVLREALENPQGTLHTPNPSAALVKALLINGADILEPITSRFVPSFSSGFGRVNVANAITIVEGAQGTGFYERQFPLNSPANPMLWEENINVGASVTLKVTLVWSDPPFREIRNQLLLIVGGKRSSTVKNNVQQVVLQTPVSGEVKLSVLGTLSAEFPEQKFAVVWRVY